MSTCYSSLGTGTLSPPTSETAHVEVKRCPGGPVFKDLYSLARCTAISLSQFNSPLTSLVPKFFKKKTQHQSHKSIICFPKFNSRVCPPPLRVQCLSSKKATRCPAFAYFCSDPSSGKAATGSLKIRTTHLQRPRRIFQQKRTTTRGWPSPCAWHD